MVFIPFWTAVEPCSENGSPFRRGIRQVGRKVPPGMTERDDLIGRILSLRWVAGSHVERLSPRWALNWISIFPPLKRLPEKSSTSPTHRTAGRPGPQQARLVPPGRSKLCVSTCPKRCSDMGPIICTPFVVAVDSLVIQHRPGAGTLSRNRLLILGSSR
jgi:hypothetical protein